MSEKIKIGDIVLVPCFVKNIGQFTYTEAIVLDLSPMMGASQEPYNKIMTIYADDVLTEDEIRELYHGSPMVR